MTAQAKAGITRVNNELRRRGATRVVEKSEGRSTISAGYAANLALPELIGQRTNVQAS